jgi:hypothetical protein
MPNQTTPFKKSSKEETDPISHMGTDDDENAGKIHAENLLSRAEAQVRENEDASLQDDTYTFDSDNTYSDEGIDDFDVSDVGGGMSEFDVDNNDDYV